MREGHRATVCCGLLLLQAVVPATGQGQCALDWAGCGKSAESVSSCCSSLFTCAKKGDEFWQCVQQEQPSVAAPALPSLQPPLALPPLPTLATPQAATAVPSAAAAQAKDLPEAKNRGTFTEAQQLAELIWRIQSDKKVMLGASPDEAGATKAQSLETVCNELAPPPKVCEEVFSNSDVKAGFESKVCENCFVDRGHWLGRHGAVPWVSPMPLLVGALAACAILAVLLRVGLQSHTGKAKDTTGETLPALGHANLVEEEPDTDLVCCET